VSSNSTSTAVGEPERSQRGPAPKRHVRRRRVTPLRAHGEPMVWLTGGSLALGLLMVFGLFGLVAIRGFSTLWPSEVVRFTTESGEVVLGQVRGSEERLLSEDQLGQLEDQKGAETLAAVRANGARTERRRVRSVNLFDTDKNTTAWFDDFQLEGSTAGLDGAWERVIERPEWALTVERYAEGRYFGELVGFRSGGTVEEDLDAAWAAFEASRARVDEARADWKYIVGVRIGRELSAATKDAELSARKVALRKGEGSVEHLAAVARAEELGDENALLTKELQAEANTIEQGARDAALLVRNARGEVDEIEVWDVVRAIPANRIGTLGALGVYVDRWLEFLIDDPRKANMEGGVFPAIFGTVLLTLLMCFVVVPFGVLAALYLREYAKQGLIVSIVRVAVNNLAGVPSIVFGVFGLGFFCYFVGGELIDPLFFPHYGNEPVYGGGGIMWASLTLALLTLPVVIVATEEALAAVPSSMREGSYACGATKWQTIRRIVLPRAMPGIMTGMILAIARGAGEVAPLMLVGAMKVAQSLPLDAQGLHPERKFMHLGFHIYDLGFQSPDSEAAIPMVYTTTLLLILIVVALNLTGVWVRSRLRQRYAAAGA
jgi:phosphate transport system permease protein